MKHHFLDTKEKIWDFHHFGKYWVVLGVENLYIFAEDGIILSKTKIRPSKVAYLSGDILLVDSLKYYAYILYSLKDGTELGRIKQPRLESNFVDFGITKDEKTAYDTFENPVNFQKYIAVIRLSELQMDYYPIEKPPYKIADMKLNDKEMPCLLETETVEVSGERVCSCSIRNLIMDQNKSNRINYEWKSKWNFEIRKDVRFFLEDTKTVLTDQLYIYNTQDGTEYYLLENDLDLKIEEPYPLRYRMDKERNLLILMLRRENLIVDLSARKLVARYAVDFSLGQLVGDEFWYGTKKGICRKPFPMMEELPPENKSAEMFLFSMSIVPPENKPAFVDSIFQQGLISPEEVDALLKCQDKLSPEERQIVLDKLPKGCKKDD